VLKSGCGIEKAQLRTTDSLKKYVVLKSIVAWRLFWLSRLHEEQGDQSCENVLSPIEWKLLYRKVNKTKPSQPPTISEALSNILLVCAGITGTFVATII